MVIIAGFQFKRFSRCQSSLDVKMLTEISLEVNSNFMLQVKRLSESLSPH